MNVLVACEFSGIVRDAFKRKGHNAWSCDLLATDRPGQHHVGDVIKFLESSVGYWDLMIAHPPCTFLCNSGVLHLYNSDASNNEARWEAMREGATFFKTLLDWPIPKKAIENPIMHGHAKRFANISKQSQTVQPWQFGHDEMKATCLWIDGLPLLKPTKVIPPPYEDKVHRMAPSVDRWKLRSITYQGIADAMADQWGAKAWV